MISQKYFNIADCFFLRSGVAADVKIRGTVGNAKEMRQEKIEEMLDKR